MEDKTLKIDVSRAEGVKCPRCWNYHTIQGNPENVCDRCLVVVNNMIEYLVSEGRWSQEDADNWRKQVREINERWRAK